MAFETYLVVLINLLVLDRELVVNGKFGPQYLCLYNQYDLDYVIFDERKGGHHHP